MPIQKSEKVIGETKYEITTIRADLSLGLLKRMILFIGPASGGLSIGMIMSEIVESLEKTDIVVLVKEILAASNLTMNGEPATGEREWTLWFSDRLGELLDLMIFVGEVNWQSFFAALKVAADGWQEKSKNDSK